MGKNIFCLFAGEPVGFSCNLSRASDVGSFSLHSFFESLTNNNLVTWLESKTEMKKITEQQQILPYTCLPLFSSSLPQGLYVIDQLEVSSLFY